MAGGDSSAAAEWPGAVGMEMKMAMALPERIEAAERAENAVYARGRACPSAVVIHATHPIIKS